MNDLNEKYLNVTLKNASDEHEEEQISISIVGILKNLKRFFAIWISLTIIASVLALVGTALARQDSYKKMVSLVNFTFDGIERGVDPNGNEFNINSLKSPQIIEKSFDKLNIPAEKLESVRKNISFESMTPQEEIERLTAYKNIFDAGNNNSMSAIDQILAKGQHPTTYKVYFDYAPTGLTSNEAASLLNTILEEYSEYFMEAYGYNKSLGSSLAVLDYTEYDYAEAVDVFSATLSKLADYVRRVESTEKENGTSSSTRFRSSETGYTFPDLIETINTTNRIDLQRISSYVTLNTITKDKDTLLTNYTYKLEALERQKTVDTETLATVNASIAGYEKNTVMIYGSDDINSQTITASQSSEEYDNLFRKKEAAQENLSRTIQDIDRYKKRIERLNSSTSVSSSAKKERVESDLAKLNQEVEELITLVNKTTDDFYKTVVFSKAYNILVPANSSFSNATKHALNDAITPIAIADALIFVIYFAAAVILSCVEEYIKNHSEEEKEPQEAAASN